MLIVNGNAIFFIWLLVLFNFFTLYFYIQNVRYVINNNPNNFYVYVNNVVYLSEVTMFILLGSLLLNLGGVLYLADYMILLMNFVI